MGGQNCGGEKRVAHIGKFDIMAVIMYSTRRSVLDGNNL